MDSMIIAVIVIAIIVLLIIVVVVISTPKGGRYIKISLPVAGILSLSGIQVFSVKDGPDIINPSMKVAQSSNLDAINYPASNILLPDRTSFTHTAENDLKPFLIVDLGKAMPIYKIVIYNRDGFTGRIKSAVISVLDKYSAVLYESAPIDDPEHMAFAVIPPSKIVVGL